MIETGLPNTVGFFPLNVDQVVYRLFYSRTQFLWKKNILVIKFL